MDTTPNHSISINEALIDIYVDKYSECIKFDNNQSVGWESSRFFYYIEDKFNEFKKIVSRIDKEELEELLKNNEDFLNPKTKRRFLNLISKLCKGYLEILKDCYKPNPLEALQGLMKLLGVHNSKYGINKYLNEQLINYSFYQIKSDVVLYRVRDCNKANSAPDNCWHVPYNLRENSYSGRYSSPGFPCFYVSENVKTCEAETGTLRDDCNRWVGSFSLKPKQIISVLDLTFPSKKDIENMNSYEKFCLFLNYPLKILSSSKTRQKSEVFSEEYLFSQKLIIVLGSQSKETNGLTKIMGILYDSTKLEGGKNYVFVAPSDNNPPLKEERYSQSLCSIFDAHPVEKLQ